MGWLGKSKYNCPNCNGNCEVFCSECGDEHECPDCKGTGWNAELIDVDEFVKAERELSKKYSAIRGVGGSCEWIEGEKRIGRRIVQMDGTGMIEGIRATDYLYDQDLAKRIRERAEQKSKE